MDLEIINKLYLELSQIATAKTDREIRACNAHDELVKVVQDCIEQLEMIPFYEKTNSDIVAVTNAKRILNSIEKGV